MTADEAEDRGLSKGKLSPVYRVPATERLAAAVATPVERKPPGDERVRANSFGAVITIAVILVLAIASSIQQP